METTRRQAGKQVQADLAASEWMIGSGNQHVALFAQRLFAKPRRHVRKRTKRNLYATPSICVVKSILLTGNSVTLARGAAIAVARKNWDNTTPVMLVGRGDTEMPAGATRVELLRANRALDRDEPISPEWCHV
ncbi:hypothetical protein [Paraburkholderia sp. RL17-373-BIF-A]|uniref:hypothetical protein n=1 Tax=Paraburkholderia sp. RL17-373-BIF-A TaxID=3031629 RepID=UPI0038B8AEF7